MMENEENNIGYYAVIPATVLFNNELKPNEKLLYALITTLANKEGYCYASNKYLGDKLNVEPQTISKWIGNLRNFNYLVIDIIRNDKKEIIQRRIYTNDIPYISNNRSPYPINNLEGINQKAKENNIIYNNINTLTQRKKKFAEKVLLYEYEYEDLLKIYGDEKTHKCIYELDLYKKEKGVDYYSDYDAIKRWVVKRVDEQAKKTTNVQNKNQQTKNSFANNYEQREYSDDYWNQFYIN